MIGRFRVPSPQLFDDRVATLQFVPADGLEAHRAVSELGAFVPIFFEALLIPSAYRLSADELGKGAYTVAFRAHATRFHL